MNIFFTNNQPLKLLLKCFILILVLSPFVTQAQYCPTGATSLLDEDIENVFLKGNTITLDNFSGNVTPCGLYSDYTANVAVPDLTAGGQYTLVIKVKTCNTGGFVYNHQAQAWIDYNRNNGFEANEAVTAVAKVVNGPGIFSYTFNVPCNISPGTTRMRIVDIEGTVLTNPGNSCNTFTYGEAEDYTVSLGYPTAITANYLIPSTVWVKAATTFINTNTTGNNVHSWDVNNDGSVEAANTTNLTFAFPTAGNKCLELKSSNCAGSDSIVKCFNVVAPTSAPAANFVAGRTSVEIYDVLKIFDLSTNGAYVWTWNVYDSVTYAQQGLYPSLASGDVMSNPLSNGNTEFSKNPEFSFEKPGIYTITLIAKNDVGSSPLFKKTLYINVSSSTVYNLGFGLYGPNSDNNVGTPSGSIFDDGGATGNYGNNQGLGTRAFLLITPCNALSIELTMTQLVFADAGDKLSVYDGTSASAKLLASWNSTSTAPASVIAKSGSMYILFESNSSGVKDGFAGVYKSVLGPATPPTPSFTMPSLFYNLTPGTFTNTTQNMVGIPSWAWTINGVEPAGSTQKDLNYVFATDGKYEVCLEIKSCIGNSKSCDSVDVITPNTPTKVDFTASNFRPVIKTEIVTLKAITDKANRFEWSISPITYTLVNPPAAPSKSGSGFIKYNATPNNTIPQPQIKFNAPGCYTVFLKAYNAVDSTNTDATILKIDYICVLEYCKPNSFILSQDIGINNVVIRDGAKSLMDNTSVSGVEGYSDFSATQKAVLTYGKQYTLEIDRNNHQDPANRTGWVDWNFDGDFSDSGEQIFFEPSTYTKKYTTTFRVPALANSLEGTTRMRVAISYNNDNAPICGPVNAGEYEDYGLTLVKDNSKPVITLKGNDTVYIEVGKGYQDSGAIATDESEGDISNTIAATTDVDANTVGYYTYVYNVTDKSGNPATPVTRHIFVQSDLTKPVITLNPGMAGCIEANRNNALYADPGATATDNRAPFNLSSSIKVTGTVDTRKIGSYMLTYSVKDVFGNTSSVSRVVCVEDTKSPLIQNIGATNIQVGSVWVDNTSAYDDYDNNPSFTKTWDNNGILNTTIINDYSIEYKAVDQSGNDTVVKVTYHVDDYIAPVIDLNTLPVVYLEVHSTYVSVPVTVTDNYYTGSNVSVSPPTSNLNPNLLGTYQEVFTAKDASGNKSQKTRTIIVVDTKAPKIFGPTIQGCVGDNIWPMWGLSTTDNYYSPATLKPLIQIVYQDVNPMQEGFYTITYRVTDPSNNVSEDFTRNVRYTYWPNCVNSTVDVKQARTLEESVSIYPNPGAGIFTVDLNGALAEDLTIEVYNAVGQSILKTNSTVATGKVEVDLTGNATGIYTIRVSSADKVVFKQVILQ
jgi:PKD repeat protein